MPGTSTTTGLWSPPSPGSLNHNPSWQHSPGPGHSSLVSHHPPSQPVSRWPQCPCSDKAQCVGQPRLRRAAAANQDYYSLAPSAPPPVTRPDNTQQLRRRRQRCTVYSVYSTVCTVAMNVESRGWRNVRWQRPPPLHPLTIWGARPGTSSVDSSPGGDNDAEIRISCILCLVLCCHIFTSYLLCARTDDTRLLTV